MIYRIASVPNVQCAGISHKRYCSEIVQFVDETFNTGCGNVSIIALFTDMNFNRGKIILRETL